MPMDSSFLTLKILAKFQTGHPKWRRYRWGLWLVKINFKPIYLRYGAR